MLAVEHTGMCKMRTCGIADRLTAARPTVYFTGTHVLIGLRLTYGLSLVLGLALVLRLECE